MARVVVVGSVTIDEQVRPGGACVRQAGGVGIYGSIAFRKEGIDAAAVCNLGGHDEAAPERVLRRFGIAVHAGPGKRTTRFRNRIGSDGGRDQELLAVAPPIRAAALEPLLDGVDLVHLGPLHAGDIDGALFDLLGDRSVRVSLDAQGLLRASALGPVRAKPAALLPAALRLASIVKVAAGELETLLDPLGVGDRELVRRFGIEELVVTRGADGGSVVVPGGERVFYPAVPVNRSLDDTGAGDVFFAAYLAARLFRGCTIPESCLRAAERASLHVAGSHILPEDLLL